MLILSRRAAECIHLGDDIVLTIVAVGTDKVRIGVQAPAGIRILRTELDERISPSDAIPSSAIPRQEALLLPSNMTSETPLSAVPKRTNLQSFVQQHRRAA
ncbi:MAG: carbon storage regulator [Planctomycetales bacterium]|nr:carbon storage regulator [Planctomycetales bacterium]